MKDLDRPRILVDFNEMVERDVVLLSKEDSARDSAGHVINLQEGMRVYLYTDDMDDTGKPTYLLASGTAERHVASDWSAPARWRCRIDEWGEAPR
jgi:hypothetical protein